MTTEQIIWTVVIVVAALALIGFIVSSMRKRSQQDNRARAAELREEAGTRAAVIPETQARAQEAEAKAEQARLQAERAEGRAQAARGEAAQREALHEDQIRAADRLDPDVDHKARDYTPDTAAAVSGSHAAEPGQPETADPHPSGASVGTHAAERTEPATSSGTDPADTTAGASTDPDWTDPDQRDGTAGGPTGGSHRA